MKTESLQDLYLKELRDLYGSTKLLVKTLPSMMDRAELPELRQALGNHLNETKEHMSRLEKIFQMHGEKPAIKNGKTLPGMLREAEDDLLEIKSPSVRDAVILAAAQQITHYEIAAFGTLHAYSIHLGHKEAGQLLQACLNDEQSTDRKLTDIALHHLKAEEAHHVA